MFSTRYIFLHELKKKFSCDIAFELSMYTGAIQKWIFQSKTPENPSQLKEDQEVYFENSSEKELEETSEHTQEELDADFQSVELEVADNQPKVISCDMQEGSEEEEWSDVPVETIQVFI